MRAAGLVKTRRQAQQIFYSVQDEKTAVTATMLLNGRCTMEEKLKILHLPMMYEWFDKIASGEKQPNIVNVPTIGTTYLPPKI